MPRTQKRIKKITRRTQRTPKTNPGHSRINIIFDLDATLINSVFHETRYGNENPESHVNSIGPHQYVVIPGKHTPTGRTDNIMYYRPFAAELLEYLAKHPNVYISVWSTGEQKYVENICKVLIGAKWKKVMPIVISRKTRIPKFTSIISQTREIFDSDFENQAIKDLDVLFKHPKWGKTFTRKNTLLIDDNFAHYVKNAGNNIIHVPAWDGINSCDTVLFELKEWLGKLLGKKNYDMSKIQGFTLTNKLGMTFGPESNLYSDRPTTIKTISKNNTICAPRLVKYHQCIRKIQGDKTMESEKINKMQDKCVNNNLMHIDQIDKKSNTKKKPKEKKPNRKL